VSWDVALCDADDLAVEVADHTEGGIIMLGGNPRAEMSVTYNYGQLFREAWPEPLSQRSCLVVMLDGRTAAETIPHLEAAVRQLGTVQDSDYWAATPGNAGHALSVLLAWARQHPAATWSCA
jgi:uncharacterized protein with von Willebrand factor type A (vWA) domain